MVHFSEPDAGVLATPGSLSKFTEKGEHWVTQQAIKVTTEQGESQEFTLFMSYQCTAEQLPDQWVVKSEQFKSFVYGTTKQEAETVFHQAVERAIGRFHDMASLTRYLCRTGIRWRLGPVQFQN